MSLATSIVKQMDRVLTKYHPQERLIYKRFVSRSGGDALIGRGMTVDSNTTLLTPQPIYQRILRNIVGSGKFQEMLSVSSPNVGTIDADYAMLVSSSALSTTELSDSNLVIVFINPITGEEETFIITDREPQAIQGSLVFTTLYIKSTKRPV